MTKPATLDCDCLDLCSGLFAPCDHCGTPTARIPGNPGTAHWAPVEDDITRRCTSEGHVQTHSTHSERRCLAAQGQR